MNKNPALKYVVKVLDQINDWTEKQVLVISLVALATFSACGLQDQGLAF